ncbi:Wzz/FepE/Etk N-terminal domain-containing protein [Planctobacterium marinum]|uniref:Wzz/FepE/Etk N-terminal domain-containing protein n=1 Tax=Planctobacterium marinum TaxID=1631968 RepID=UPI001E491D20|nr:Wzz/FepE/Etk N-terminal domain-containing protein [Planctobacterium marinum]MCC2606102.1 LPS O-antigen length regulator [Planctobacterium marinum]
MENSQLDYSLHSLLKFLLAKKLLIVLIPFGVVLLTALWTLTISNTYLSETTLSPTEEASGGGLSNLSGQLGGLASLAGISLGGESTDQVTVALEIIKSRQFIANFVSKYNIKKDLMASSEYNAENNLLVIDPDLYDEQSQTWTRPSINGRPPEPTNLEVYESFLQRLTVERDPNTGLIKLALEFYSPHLAQEWLTLLVNQLNSDMRRREIQSAKENIEYLEAKVQQIGDIEMKTVFYQLIQEQTKQLMLAEVRTDFVFTIIDPPYTPELKHAPRRALICIAAAFLSGFLVIAWFTLIFLITPRR